MHLPKKWLVLIILFAIVFMVIMVWQQYNSNRGVVGAGCDYDTSIVIAKVIKIVAYPHPLTYDSMAVLVEVITKDKPADTLDLAHTNQFNPYSNELLRTRLKAGDHIKCIYTKRIDIGPCPPYCYYFDLQGH